MTAGNRHGQVLPGRVGLAATESSYDSSIDKC